MTDHSSIAALPSVTSQIADLIEHHAGETLDTGTIWTLSASIAEHIAHPIWDEGYDACHLDLGQPASWLRVTANPYRTEGRRP